MDPKSRAWVNIWIQSMKVTAHYYVSGHKWILSLINSVADVYPDPGSDFFHPGSWIQSQKDFESLIQIRIKKNLSILTQKNCF